MPKHKQDVGELWITFLSQFVFHFFKSADAGIFLLIFVLFTFQFKCKGCNFNCINWKIHRWWAWDSNPGWQDGRRRRIHWPPVFHFFKNGPFPASFSLFSSFQDSWQFAYDWIRTVDLWNWKEPLYQLRHNHCVSLFTFHFFGSRRGTDRLLIESKS